MTHIATQYDAFYIQRKCPHNAVCAQLTISQPLTQTSKYYDICGPISSWPKIFDSRIGCYVNYLDKRQVVSVAGVTLGSVTSYIGASVAGVTLGSVTSYMIKQKSLTIVWPGFGLLIKTQEYR